MELIKKYYLFLLLPLLAYFLFLKSKPKRKRKKRRVIKTKFNKVSSRARPSNKSAKANIPIRSLADMPVKYRVGCKGKKGKELGKCLQYWRKYRINHPLKK